MIFDVATTLIHHNTISYVGCEASQNNCIAAGIVLQTVTDSNIFENTIENIRSGNALQTSGGMVNSAISNNSVTDVHSGNYLGVGFLFVTPDNFPNNGFIFSENTLTAKPGELFANGLLTTPTIFCMKGIMVRSNTISNFPTGLENPYICSGEGINVIEKNNFVSNAIQIHDLVNTPSTLLVKQNYFNDWTGTNCNPQPDGYCGNPYVLTATNQDSQPKSTPN
jgi:hypothetical protein